MASKSDHRPKTSASSVLPPLHWRVLPVRLKASQGSAFPVPTSAAAQLWSVDVMGCDWLQASLLPGVVCRVGAKVPNVHRPP